MNSEKCAVFVVQTLVERVQGGTTDTHVSTDIRVPSGFFVYFVLLDILYMVK